LWDDQVAPSCPACGGAQQRLEPLGEQKAPTVIGDEIDVTIPHGLCYDDGTPRRFRSRSELKAAERAKGLRLLERGEKFKGQESRIANRDW
jgi:hypothetical protein